MEHIYVITEDVGEWSDHTTSVICVCLTEQLAKSRVLELTERAKLKAMTDKQIEDTVQDFYDENPPPLSRDFHPSEYKQKVEEWRVAYEKFQTDEFDKIYKTIDTSTFDETKDRYYDYPHYTYKTVEFHKE